MNYIIDTHILLWSIFSPEKLDENHRKLLASPNNTIFVTSISLWEISLKYCLGKLELYGFKPDDLIQVCSEMDIEIININEKSMASYYQLPNIKDHKDPFDRLIVWYCIKNAYVLITQDSKIPAYERYGLILI